MNQALAYIMLTVVGLTVVAPIVLYAQSNIASNVMSYNDFVVLENKRASQQTSVTHVQHDDTIQEIHIHLVNSGLEDITFAYVLADGVELKHETISLRCWDPGNPKVEIGYCFYTAALPDNNTDPDTVLPVDGSIRIGITYDPGVFPTGPEKIQLVTDAFKLFEITIA